MARYLFLFFIILLLPGGCSRYNAKKADTQENRKGFARVTGIDPGSDVTEIYFYADELGWDPLYCFSFQCSRKTAQKIIEHLKLKKNENADWQEPFPVPDDLFWWNSEERKNSVFYCRRMEQPEKTYYFWFHPRSTKCQFMMICF